MKKFITLLLVLTGCVMSAFADPWIGGCAINVNGTWYRGDNTPESTWAGTSFSSANLGALTTLELGGQVQYWENSEDKKGTAYMYYKFDSNAYSDAKVDLTWYKKANNNNFFQSGGDPDNQSAFSTTSIDISGLSWGTHTLTIKFKYGTYETASYSATFFKGYDISSATVTGVDDTNWTGSVIHPVPVVKIGDITLTSGTDYSVSYSAGCIEVGEYTVTITGLANNFTGTKNVNFKIKLPDGYYLVRNSNSWTLDPSNKLTQNPSNDKEYYIRNIVLSADDEIKVVHATNNAGTTVWYPGGSDPNYKPGKGTYDIYCRPDGQGGAGWHYGTLYASAQSSVDVTLAPTGYGTYYNGACEATLPSGAAAYILKDATPSYEKIADGDGETKTIPAGTAVLLYGASSSITLTLSTSKTDDRTFASNKLHGSDVSKTTTGADGSVFYKLTYGSASGHESQFGWYYGADGGAAFASPAHKAWLALPAAASRSFFGLPDDDNTTGISSVESKQQDVNSVWYDLNGRRVIAPTSKGIYVKDGRKVVIK